MRNISSIILLLIMGFWMHLAHAVDLDAVVGGAVGGGLGAAVGSELGGRKGAIAGSAVGAAVGTAIATSGDNADAKVGSGVQVNGNYKSGGPPPHAYQLPPGHVKHHKKKEKW